MARNSAREDRSERDAEQKSTDVCPPRNSATALHRGIKLEAKPQQQVDNRRHFDHLDKDKKREQRHDTRARIQNEI